MELNWIFWDYSTKAKEVLEMMRHIGFKNRYLYIIFNDEPKFKELNKRGKMKRLRNLLPIKFFPNVYPEPKMFFMLPWKYCSRWCMRSINKW